MALNWYFPTTWSIDVIFTPLADFKGALIQYYSSGNWARERQSRFLSAFRQQNQNNPHTAGIPVCHTWYIFQETLIQTELCLLISMLEIDYFFQSSNTLHQKWRLVIGPDDEGTSHLMKYTSSISMCSIEIVITIPLYYSSTIFVVPRVWANPSCFCITLNNTLHW